MSKKLAEHNQFFQDQLRETQSLKAQIAQLLQEKQDKQIAAAEAKRIKKAKEAEAYGNSNKVKQKLNGLD